MTPARAARWLAALGFAVAISSSSRAEPWTDTDRALAATAIALHLADWSQTLRIIDTPGLYERNPVLGRHPSRGEVSAYFAGTGALIALLAYALPEYRRALLTGYVAVGLIAVGNNVALGVRIGF